MKCLMQSILSIESHYKQSGYMQRGRWIHWCQVRNLRDGPHRERNFVTIEGDFCECESVLKWIEMVFDRLRVGSNEY